MTAIDILQAEADAIKTAIQAVTSPIFQRFYIVLSRLKDSGNKLIVTGVGKSAIVARKISATMATLCIPAVFIDSIGLYHGELGCIVYGDVVLLISHSGKTDELVRLYDPLRAAGAQVYSLVSERNSPLGNLDNAVVTGIEREAYLMIPTCSSAAAVAVGEAAAIMAAQLNCYGKDHLAIVHPGGTIGIKIKEPHDVIE